MLTQMRALSQHFIGRAIMAVVLGLIILSFAIWGIGDRFTNFNADQLAQIGSTKITVDQYRNAYQTELQQLQEKAKRGITNAEAKRMGVDRQVLSHLLTNAILDQEAVRLGLAVGDTQIARAILQDPIFRGADGKFDRSRFNALLADNNMNERIYVKDQRDLILRQDVSDAVVGDLDVPKDMAAAIHRYQSEVRDLEFFVLPPSAAGQAPTPTPTELQAFYDERPTAFTAPEYRKLVILSIVPVDLVKPEAIPAADVKKRYDEMKDARFVVPEKRTVQQLFFPDAAAAAAARAKLDHGTSFEQLVKDEKKTDADVNLGTVAKDQLAEPALADAAFALPDGGTSQPVTTKFGSVLLHVSKVLPRRQQAFEEVAPELRDELAIVRAKEKANRLRDAIEDQRTAGKTLSEAATSVGLKTRTIDAVDSKGFDKAHKPVEGLVDGTALLKAAFSSDIGADTEMLQGANGGDVWYEVAGIDAAHKLPLAEVKPRIEMLWRADETARRLAKEGDAIVAAIDAGKPLAAAAAEHGNLQVMKAENVSRTGAPELPASVAAAAFEVRTSKAGSAGEPGGGRIVFQVEAARVPPMKPGDADFDKLMTQVKSGVVDDVIAQYLSSAQHEIGVKLNQRALQSALSDDSGS